MKHQPLPEPERWSERSGGTSIEDAVGATLRRIQDATLPSNAAVARWTRLAMATSPHRPARVAWPAIVFAAALLGGGGVVAARAVWHGVVARQSPAPVSKDGAMALAGPPSRRVRRPDPPPSAPLDEPEPPSTDETAPPPVTLPRARPPRTVPSEPAASSLGPNEGQLLASVFRDLRARGDASAALVDLDEYARRYPTGRLATEAALARAEALVALGRTDDALPILLGIQDPRAGLTRDVRVARAELLARAGRCAEAALDFDELVARGTSDAPAERALYGRAACRLRAGDEPAAQADLRSYLAAYPDGRFASAVRVALEKLERP
jgi:TolA-binding protein